jgi:hypothetical protein
MLADPDKEETRIDSEEIDRSLALSDPWTYQEVVQRLHGNHPIPAGAVEEITFNDLQLRSYDGSLHPPYSFDRPTVYETRESASNAEKTKNVEHSTAVSLYFLEHRHFHSRDLWNHYYTNTGDPYFLDSETVNRWIKDDRNEYNDGTLNPARVIDTDKKYAISIAKSLAKVTGKPVKYSYAGPWRTTAGIDGDYVQSLGHHQMTTSTTVLAYPDENGGVSGEYTQQYFSGTGIILILTGKKVWLRSQRTRVFKASKWVWRSRLKSSVKARQCLDTSRK